MSPSKQSIWMEYPLPSTTLDRALRVQSLLLGEIVLAQIALHVFRDMLFHRHVTEHPALCFVFTTHAYLLNSIPPQQKVTTWRLFSAACEAPLSQPIATAQ